MKIILAGYNLDTEVIESLKQNCANREDVTPETLSAAYARISRDARPVDDLRAVARGEVDKARKSNRSIIFQMGHHSVAEHAVFNFDILGVSRLAIEEIEKFRLASYTEKSQRYQELKDDFVVPNEIKGGQFEGLFVKTIKEQNECYHRIFGALKPYVFKVHHQLALEEKNHRMIEGWAKEDARYIVSLATEGQLGETINARNLELLFRRFASHELAEIREIGERMYTAVEKIAPSIILFTKANDYDRKTHGEMKALAGKIMKTGKRLGTWDLPACRQGRELGAKEVDLLNFTKDGDSVTIAALLHSSSALPYSDCLKTTKKMKDTDKRKLIMTALSRMELFDAAPREFEYVNLTYDLIVSSACFGQLKRHRLASITCQPYDPKLGVKIPESIKEVKMEKEFLKVVGRTNDAFEKIAKKMPAAAQYILTNSHRKRVLFGTNARELYHISRLREDWTAQWDIREITAKMTEQAKKLMPVTMLLIGGKDKYPEIYKKVYGHFPKIIEPSLPK
jgi:flavin-dependent thymidylate synthase